MPHAPKPKKLIWTAQGHILNLPEASAFSILSSAQDLIEMGDKKQANEFINHAKGVLKGRYSIKLHPNLFRGDLIVHRFRAGERQPDFTFYGELGNFPVQWEDWKKKHGYPSYPMADHKKAEIESRRNYVKRLKATGGVQ